MDKNKKTIYIITSIFIGMFALLILYLVYFTAVKQKQISVNPYNTRLNNLEKEVIRGDIYDTNMKLLATTVNGKRNYPKGSLYAHVVGYSERGKTGVEALANTELLYPDYNVVALFKNAFSGQKFQGRDIVLTLDDRYQTAIEKAMKGQKGAVIVIEPTTGKIKAMYGSPGFDPNRINEDWESLTADTKNSPLLNRVTNGLYPPGSIFKVITTLAYMNQEKGQSLDFKHDCTGKIIGDGYSIQCYNETAHGNIGLKEAFYKSCNTYFVKLSSKVSVKSLRDAAEKLGFNQPLHFDMDYAKSRFQLKETESPFEKAATYIGQGRTLTTPLHMAMIASCIANDGVMMKPYLLDYSMNKKGNLKVKYLPQYEKAMIDEEMTTDLQEMMIGVVKEGTATPLKRKNIIVGGKTGTAQNETSEDHSWFIGFAKYNSEDKNQIAFAVIVENSGNGVKAVDVTDKIVNVYQEIKP